MVYIFNDDMGQLSSMQSYELILVVDRIHSSYNQPVFE